MTPSKQDLAQELADVNACDDRCRGRCGKCPNDTIREAVARIRLLEGLVAELGSDLECEIEARYAKIKDHPAMTPKYERDMEPVNRACAALASEPKP